MVGLVYCLPHTFAGDPVCLKQTSRFVGQNGLFGLIKRLVYFSGLSLSREVTRCIDAQEYK